jgi:hypothetical protein
MGESLLALVITNSLIITSYLISLVIVSENKVTRAYSRLLTTVLCMFSCSVRFDMSRRNKAATATGINKQTENSNVIYFFVVCVNDFYFVTKINGTALLPAFVQWTVILMDFFSNFVNVLFCF